jgi:hypothetical protein
VKAQSYSCLDGSPRALARETESDAAHFFFLRFFFLFFLHFPHEQYG